MAREYARMRVDVWIDDDFRALSPAAQHLYFVLLTSPALSYCGVTDWRPGRIAALAHGWDTEQILMAAKELTERLYIVPDDVTEEVLIRSFIRHDGLMKESRVAVSMVKAFAAVASNTIRGVIVHELRRLRDEDGSLNGWRAVNGQPGQALKLLDLNAIDPTGLAHGLADHLGVGLGDGLGVGLAQTPPNVWGSVWGSTSPAPTPAPTPSPNGENITAPRKRGRRIPDDFAVTDDMRRWALDNGFGHLDLDRITDEFRDYWAAEAGGKSVKIDWVKTWHNRIRAVADRTPANVRPIRRDSSGQRTWTLDEIEAVLGVDLWTCPQPPRELDADAKWEWVQQAKREHRAERIAQAEAKLGSPA